jgi:6-methylsalicylate decarboxylase
LARHPSSSPRPGARANGALRWATDSFGADRLLLGTDFPYENGDAFARAIEYISAPQIDMATARAILDQNASALLGMGAESLM